MTTSQPLSDLLIACLSRDADENDFHVYFGECGKFDWCDIADEADRIVELIGRKRLTHDQLKGLIGAVAAHAANSALRCIDHALGLDPGTTNTAVYDDFVNGPQEKTMTASELFADLQQMERTLRGIHAKSK